LSACLQVRVIVLCGRILLSVRQTPSRVTRGWAFDCIAIDRFIRIARECAFPFRVVGLSVPTLESYLPPQPEHASKRPFIERWIAEWQSTAATITATTATAPRLDLYSVPAAGVTLPACWKHNLDFGAEADVIGGSATGSPDSDCVGIAAPEALALASCAALGLVYGAVDVVLCEGPRDGSSVGETDCWAVLEVNACPAWNHFLSSHGPSAHRGILAAASTALHLQLT